MKDLGLQTLDWVHKQLLIDEEWTERRSRGFQWAGGKLGQRFGVSEATADDDVTLFKLTCETVVVDRVKASADAIDRLLSSINRFSVGNCYSYDRTSEAIVATSSVWVHDETAAWRSKIFASYAITQLALAEAEAPFIASKLSGQVARWSHPIAGMRKRKDDMLNVLTDLLIPAGQSKSLFANQFEFETVAEISQKSPFAATIGGDETGIALETPFGDYTSISVMSTKERHRLLGYGLTTRIQLPTDIDEDSGAHLAGMLSRKERTEGPGAPHFGAWCLDKSPAGRIAVTYRLFIPNMCHMNGLIMDTAICCINRARWAARMMNGEPSKGNAWQILAGRLGFGRK